MLHKDTNLCKGNFKAQNKIVQISKEVVFVTLKKQLRIVLSTFAIKYFFMEAAAPMLFTSGIK